MEKFLTIIKERFLGNPKGDLIGGLTAAIVALPIALAFGVVSGLGAAAGLYGAIACGIFAAIFGGTPGQVSGPTGPMTVVAAGVVAAHAGRTDLVLTAFILAGVIQIGLGLLRAGRLVHHIPEPVISGFTSGIGLIIICLQVNPLFGLKGLSTVSGALRALPNIYTDATPWALLIGLLTLALIYVLPLLWRRLPATLISLFVATTLSVWLGINVPRIGSVPEGIPLPILPSVSWSDITLITGAAIYLALLGSLDSLMTSVIIDKLTGKNHDSNQELIGQGIGNAIAGMFGGLPGAGATMRSVVNVRTGGTSYLSGVVHGLILLTMLIGLGKYAALIPLSSLAAVLISVGIGIIDHQALKDIRNGLTKDSIVMLCVFLLTIFADLVIAVGAGILLYHLIAKLKP